LAGSAGSWGFLQKTGKILSSLQVISMKSSITLILANVSTTKIMKWSFKISKLGGEKAIYKEIKN
jgi:hypothetical protein